MNFGGLGGLGGRSPSFPVRFGAPVSNSVQSLEELQKPIWDEYQNAVNARTQSSNDFWTKYQGTLDARTDFAGPNQSQLDRTFKVAASRGPGAEWVFAHDPNAEAIANEYNDAHAPVDMAAYTQRAQAIAQPYLENQTRNQQAYDSMTNNGQVNALIGPDYSNANFGSISGQGAAQLPQIDGVNMDWAQGVYNPSQANGMFGNTGRTNKQGWL
jgi:hypothetical protein